MNKYVVFMRGVNVGGNAPVNMTALRDALTENNYEDVKTYINSGNILICSKDDKKKLNEKLKQIIRAHFGISIEMVIKTKNELERIVEQNPFDSEREGDNSKRIVAMLSEKIDEDKAMLFRKNRKVEENYYFVDDLIYIYYHNGAGKSKFTNTYIEKKLQVISTARNWNTILKMLEFCNIP